MKSLVLISALSLLFFQSFFVIADDSAEATIRTSLLKLDPDFIPTKIEPSPVPGLYQVIIGAEVLYVTDDGQYIVQGDMFSLRDEGKVWSVTEEVESKARSVALQSIPEEEIITFAPDDKPIQDTIYVFTDITCGYCRKLHRDVPELNENGIAVKYLAYPRGGLETTGAFELSAVWCSEDRNKAMTDAKSGVSIDISECNNPVAKHLDMGNSFGVSGTPAIFLENGYRVPGYLPPEQLLPMVREKSGA